MRKDLLNWQWALYAGGHRDRLSLLLHIVTVPLFWLGTAMLFQGREHAREREAPVPFNGPFDFASRFFAEQFVTFPRYVLSGGGLKAWRVGS